MMDELQRRDASLAAASARAEKPSRGAFMRRTLSIEKREVDEEARTVELAFSSESPVERWYGIEVLSHDKGAMRMDRLNNGAALLLNHDAGQHVGVVESARMDNDKRGRAVVRFGRSALAEEVWQDVRDGIRSLVSVGYIIHDIEETTPRNGIPEIRVTDWEPLEVSIVSVPADASVGVGRHFTAGSNEEGSEMDHDTEAHDVRDIEQSPDVGGGDEIIETRDESPDRTKVDAEIRRLGERWKCADQAEQLIEIGGTVDDMREAVRNAIKTRGPVALDTDRSTTFVADAIEPVRYRGELRGFRSERDAYATGQWIKARFLNDQRAHRWCRDYYSRAMSGGIASAGGFLVPDEMSDAIIDLREDRGIARQIADVVVMNRDTLSIPRVTSGVTAYWTGENTSGTEDDMAFDSINLVARKLMSVTRVSTELLEDSAIDLAMKLSERIAYGFADKEDEAFINGDGTSTYGGIVGLRPKIIDGTHTAGAVDAASGIDTFAEVTADDLNSLMAACPAYALRNARWLCSQPAKALVFDALAQAAGGNTIMSMGDRPAFQYLGYPIAMSQVMPTSTGDLSNVAMLAFGDFSKAVTLGDRREFRLEMSTDRYFEVDQVAWRATQRLDIVWHDLGDTSTAGPVVALIGE